MKTSQVAAATMTWARSAAEEELLRRSLTRLAASGIAVAVADRSGLPQFDEFLERLPGVRVAVPAASGLVAQVQASVALAAERHTPFILYTEPDKETFFARRLCAFIEAAPDDADVGVVLAARSPASFRTFPPTQRAVERVTNRRCAEVVGRSGDYTYGPFLMSRALLPAVAAMNRTLGWGWRLATFVLAGRLGLRVVHVTGDHRCPPQQQAEDAGERQHRRRQLRENIAGLSG